MLSLQEQLPGFLDLDRECKELGKLIVSGLSPSKANLRLEGQKKFQMEEDQVFLVKEGILDYRVFDRSLYKYDGGDLIGLEHAFYPRAHELSTDFAVVVDAYSRTDLSQAFEQPARREIWTKYLLVRHSLLVLLVASAAEEIGEALPEFKNFEAGQTIVAEGEHGQTVFNLVEGHAEVLVGDKKVGEVLQDEIFGALSPLAGTPRTATVKATERCLVISLSAEHFVSLARTRPHTVVKLVKDMARTIVNLNQRVLDAER